MTENTHITPRVGWHCVSHCPKHCHIYDHVFTVKCSVNSEADLHTCINTNDDNAASLPIYWATTLSYPQIKSFPALQRFFSSICLTLFLLTVWPFIGDYKGVIKGRWFESPAPPACTSKSPRARYLTPKFLLMSSWKSWKVLWTVSRIERPFTSCICSYGVIDGVKDWLMVPPSPNHWPPARDRISRASAAV